MGNIPAPLPLSPFSPPDRDRRGDSPVWSGRGSRSVHGILQARILEWVSMASSRGSSRTKDQTHISYVSCIVGGFFTTSATKEAL